MKVLHSSSTSIYTVCGGYSLCRWSVWTSPPSTHGCDTGRQQGSPLVKKDKLSNPHHPTLILHLSVKSSLQETHGTSRGVSLPSVVPSSLAFVLPRPETDTRWVCRHCRHHPSPTTGYGEYVLFFLYSSCNDLLPTVNDSKCLQTTSTGNGPVTKCSKKGPNFLALQRG